MAEQRVRPRRPRRRQPDAAPVAPEGHELTEGDGERSDQRLSRLRDGLTGLRTRGANIDVERALMTAGAVLLPLGIAAIVLGWAGAAGTPYTFEQVPYLISGGLLGLALAVVGGFLYFGYWITRLMREQREQSDRLGDALGRIETLLGGGGVARNGSAQSPGVRSPGTERAGRGRARAPFVATASGSMFHLPACPVVADRSGLKRVTGREKGYEPCAVCDPLAAV